VVVEETVELSEGSLFKFGVAVGISEEFVVVADTVELRVSEGTPGVAVVDEP